MSKSAVLSKDARDCINQYTEDQASLNNLDVAVVSDGENFTLTPQVEQVWVDTLAEDDGLLKKISIDTCEDRICEDLGWGPYELVSGRVDTDVEDRQTSGLGSPDSIQYTAEPTNFDTHFTFSELNRWARRKDQFQKRLFERRKEIKQADLKKIAWNGVKVAVKTDKKTYPLGQDVNIGWPERMRQHKPSHVISKIDGKPITVGKHGMFKNLDELAVEAISLIPREYRAGLEIFVSDELMTGREIDLVSESDVTEKAQAIAQKAAGIINGKPASTPDYFLEGTMFICNPKNLAIRVQEESVRPGYTMNNKRSRYENYNTQNEFFAIHVYGACVMVEGITLANAPDEG